MSLATRNKNCSYCCDMDSASIVFDICYFMENFRYLHTNHGCGYRNPEIRSSCCC